MFTGKKSLHFSCTVLFVINAGIILPTTCNFGIMATWTDITGFDLKMTVEYNMNYKITK